MLEADTQARALLEALAASTGFLLGKATQRALAEGALLLRLV